MLRSPLVDLLVGPHGIDRYLELIRPEITVHDARAKVVEVRRQTPRSVTVTLVPNAAWGGFRAGQFARVGVEIDGVRRTRTYSPASAESANQLELTITVHPAGLVSSHLYANARPGMILHLGEASGDFVLPQPTNQPLVLISGGSGITPVLSMLRTLCERGHREPIAFVHFARTRADWLYRAEVEELARAHANLAVEYIATREGGQRLCAALLERVGGPLDRTRVAVCGPPPLIDAARELCPNTITETFTPPLLTVSGEQANGTLRFVRSNTTAPIAAGTLLEQAEAAGLTPGFGCRMGICHTCTCRKLAGPVRNLRTGATSDEDDEDIQLCVSVPAGDVALAL